MPRSHADAIITTVPCVDKGKYSQFVMSKEELHRRIKPPTPEKEHATAYFRLGIHFRQEVNQEQANRLLEQAALVWPGIWTYMRQSWYWHMLPDSGTSLSLALRR